MAIFLHLFNEMKDENKLKKIIVIAGPTAVGKTSLSIELCKIIGGEIVSADSMQVYKGLDIGTAKPTFEEREGVFHHMIDVCEPSHKYSVAEYLSGATASVEKIFSKGKIPVVVGGTGLYIDHLIYDNNFEDGHTNFVLRENLNKRVKEFGIESLKRELEKIDPESANRLHSNDVKRIVRALEFYYVSGTTITEHNKYNSFSKKRYDADVYVLNCRREKLYERINERVDLMMEKGLLEEAEKVCSADWFENSTASQAIGYKEFLPYFYGIQSLKECVDGLKQHSRNYAKRQISWFKGRHSENFLDIFDTVSPLDAILQNLRKGK